METTTRYAPEPESFQPTRPLDDALLSPAASPDLGELGNLYAGLIGSWDVEVIDYGADESRQTTPGEWHFAWALEGRAVQDVFIVPRRGMRSGLRTASKGNRYGTTIRFPDPVSGQWLIIWINPANGSVNRLTARREGDAIVQVGTDPDGTVRRWTFVEIAPERFHWTGEESNDDGATWRKHTEFFACRRPDAAGA